MKHLSNNFILLSAVMNLAVQYNSISAEEAEEILRNWFLKEVKDEDL